jgi:hypothetical protein
MTVLANLIRLTIWTSHSSLLLDHPARMQRQKSRGWLFEGYRLPTQSLYDQTAQPK